MLIENMVRAFRGQKHWVLSTHSYRILYLGNEVAYDPYGTVFEYIPEIDPMTFVT